MKDNKDRFRRIMAIRKKTNSLYVSQEKLKAQMDFYKSALDAQKKKEQNS